MEFNRLDDIVPPTKETSLARWLGGATLVTLETILVRQKVAGFGLDV